ncbi:MAG TPA: epoxyqueuosine reductase QueH [Bacteroidales bacterium]|nr:epoxyqueuosine reductase QueH [Bacteroidales bacterium]HQB56386.1 epoxyqueuosine reductase QueH [Bacteroidales bacterium]
MKNPPRKLLLHVCCGPCSTTALERLSKNFDIAVFFFNPNIGPTEEYELRRNESKRFLKQAYGDKVKFIEGDPDPGIFYRAVRGLEKEPEGGLRCQVCYRLRLEETARHARNNRFDLFCTTLTVSPRKDAVLINRIGTETAEKTGAVSYLPSDFKKQDGFRRSVEISKENGLYRQNYCGCVFSKEHPQKMQ